MVNGTQRENLSVRILDAVERKFPHGLEDLPHRFSLSSAVDVVRKHLLPLLNTGRHLSPKEIDQAVAETILMQQ